MDSAQTGHRTQESAGRRGGIGRAAGVGLFLLALWTPLVVGVLGSAPEISATERRPRAPWPSLATGADLLAFPEGLDAWWNDRVGLRSTFLRANTWLRLRALGVSPSPGLLVGRDGWLFRGGRNGRQLAGGLRLDDDQLASWRAILEERRAWLRSRGVTYLVVLVPFKGQIYPEYLPRFFVREGPETPFDQLARVLAATSDVPVLYLEQPLLAAKGDGRLFHRTDLHWNDLGAYVAYRAILAELERTVPALAGARPVGIRTRRRTGPSLGLATIFGLGDYFSEEEILVDVVAPPAGGGAAANPADLARDRREGQRVRVGTGRAGDPRALVFRDSFGAGLVPFLGHHFSEIEFVWNRDVDPAAVEKFRPDVVIHEIWVGTVGGQQWGPPKAPRWKTPIRPPGV